MTAAEAAREDITLPATAVSIGLAGWWFGESQANKRRRKKESSREAAQETAQKLGIDLTAADRKALAQLRINGEMTNGVKRAFNREAVEQVNNRMGKLLRSASKWSKFVGKAAKRVVPIISFSLTANSKANAYYSGTRNGNTGVVGVLEQPFAEAELAEDFILRPGLTSFADFMEDNLMPKGPNRRVQDGGFDENGFPLYP